MSPRRCDLQRLLSAPVGSFSWCLHGFVRHLGRVSRPSFSREERGAPRSPPPTLRSSWDRCRPRGGQGRSGGPRAQGADLRALSTLGAVGERPDPVPWMRSPEGGMWRGVRAGHHPRTLVFSTRSEARLQKPHVRAAAQEAACPGVGVWTQFTRDASLAWPSGPTEQGAGRPAAKAGSGSAAGTVARDPVPA